MNKLKINQLKLYETSDMDPHIPVTNVLQEYIKLVSELGEYKVEGEKSVRGTISNLLIVNPIK